MQNFLFYTMEQKSENGQKMELRLSCTKPRFIVKWPIGFQLIKPWFNNGYMGARGLTTLSHF